MSNTENQKLGGVPLSYLTLDTRRSIVKSSTSLLEEITAKMNKNTLTIASGTNVGQHI
jgi:hypothetical protein